MVLWRKTTNSPQARTRLTKGLRTVLCHKVCFGSSSCIIVYLCEFFLLIICCQHKAMFDSMLSTQSQRVKKMPPPSPFSPPPPQKKWFDTFRWAGGKVFHISAIFFCTSKWSMSCMMGRACMWANLRASKHANTQCTNKKMDGQDYRVHSSNSLTHCFQVKLWERKSEAAAHMLQIRASSNTEP